MEYLVRRSNLMAPVTVERYVQGAWRYNADAITLDLADGVLPSDKAAARGMVRDALPLAARGGAEVFVRANKQYLEADVEASAYPGLTGVMLSKVEEASEVTRAADILDVLERKRGLDPGSLKLIPLLESALGVWNIREIITASPRVSDVALGEGDLSCNLGIFPSEADDPFVYARGRIVIEATAAHVQPVGMAHPLGVLPRLAPYEQVLEQAARAKNLGFKGVICPHPSWVAPVNAAFTPTEEQVEYYTEVRRLYAQGVAAGTAAVPFKGRMIDVPVDERAKDVLALAAACKARNEQKRRALEDCRK